MKKIMMVLVLCGFVQSLPAQEAFLELAKGAVKKVINVIDLKMRPPGTPYYPDAGDLTAAYLDQLGLVINAFPVQMSDGERMVIIDEVEKRLSENYNDLKDFKEQNAVMSLQRALFKHFYNARNFLRLNF